VPTLLVGALGGLLVGITSVGSGSVIMIALLMLYPGLSAVKLVGTDLVQAVPLVLAAAVSNIIINGLDWSILIPLVIGSTPGSMIGSRIAPRVPQSLIRRGIVIVLTMSGIALLDKSGWAPLGKQCTHPVLIALVGVGMAIAVPLIWGLIRMTEGLPMFGKPTLTELDNVEYPALPGKDRARGKGQPGESRPGKDGPGKDQPGKDRARGKGQPGGKSQPAKDHPRGDGQPGKDRPRGKDKPGANGEGRAPGKDKPGQGKDQQGQSGRKRRPGNGGRPGNGPPDKRDRP
jgi:hypothetical protein